MMALKREHFVRIFFYECNLLHRVGSIITTIVYSITAKEKNESAPQRKHVPYYRHFVVTPKTPNRDQIKVRVHRRDRQRKEGGITRSILAESLSGPSLTGGPTSRVRPLPIQITLIGVYVRLLRHQKNGHGERKGAHSRERKKMGPNLTRVDLKNRVSEERWKSNDENKRGFRNAQYGCIIACYGIRFNTL